MHDILKYLQNHEAEMVTDIERLVRLESPSNDQAGINRAQEVNAEWFQSLGTVDRHAGPRGDVLHVRIPARSSDRTLLLAHVDTVYPVGTWEQVWRIEGDRALGPGAYDMKGGIVQAAWAIRALHALDLQPAHTIDILLTPDEEIGSESGLPHIERLALGASAVLVLEPPFMNGDLKIARKGVGDYVVRVTGRSAHQGVEPENGRNAIVSAAHLIREIIQLEDREKGTTLGPNVIRGGTVSNVVADEAILKIDLRAWDVAEAARVEAAMRRIEPLDGTAYEFMGGLNRPPMEPSEGTMLLLEKAQRIAQQLGFTLGSARVGGGSDGNFTSRLAPTLDGFGAVGAHAHQRNLEYIHIPSLAPRAALLAGMLLEAG